MKNEAKILISDDKLDSVTGGKAGCGIGYAFYPGKVGFAIDADCRNDKCDGIPVDVYPLIEESALIGVREYNISQNQNWIENKTIVFKCRHCGEEWSVTVNLPLS